MMNQNVNRAIYSYKIRIKQSEMAQGKIHPQISAEQPYEQQKALQRTNIFFRELQLTPLISFKCTHIMFFLCWFGLIVAGTTMIGYGATNYSMQYTYCNQTQQFCTYDLTMTETRQIYMYVKLSPFYQNNRLYLDGFSVRQLHGENGTNIYCQNYSSYKQMGISQTSGGYRLPQNSSIHPCGYTMKTVFNDNFYIVDDQGGTPQLNNASLSSNYSATYHYSRLPDYQIAQWTDVLNSRFVNWFNVPFTSTKYVMMGNLNMTAGDYQLVVRNSYPTNEEFTKSIILSEINDLGMTNNLLGFVVFAYGIAILLFHAFICCKSKD